MAELIRGQHPYPDEFVYTVTGCSVKDGTADLSTMKALTIVGRTPEAVIECWREEMDDESFNPMSAMSMAQIAPALDQLLAAESNPETYPKIPRTVLIGATGANRSPWLVSTATANQSTPTVVMAVSLEDVAEWAEKRNTALKTALSIAMVKDIYEQMKFVRDGHEEDEYYAIDEQDRVNARNKYKQMMSIPESRKQEMETVGRIAASLIRGE